MPKFHVIVGPDATPVYPNVRKIGPSDLKDALAKGIEDFLTMPSSLFFWVSFIRSSAFGSSSAILRICSSRSCRVSLSLAPSPRADCMRLAGDESSASTSHGKMPLA